MPRRLRGTEVRSGAGAMRVRWLVCAFIVMMPLAVWSPASATPRVPPRQEACRAFATGRTPFFIWTALTLLSQAGYEPLDSLTQGYAADPAGQARRIGVWCRSHYKKDKVIQRATFVPSPTDPTITTEEYDKIVEGMPLAQVQIIVGSVGQAGPPCPASPLDDIMGGANCYWWNGPVPDSYGGVYLQDGKVTNKYGIKI